jgi:hypothetical protein
VEDVSATVKVQQQMLDAVREISRPVSELRWETAM